MTQKGCPSLFSALAAHCSLAGSESPKRHSLLQEFERKLANKFDALKEAGEERDSMFLSVDWLLQALQVVQTTHSDAMELVPSSDLMFNMRYKWLEDYLDDTAKLLDVCIVLKAGVAVMEVYQSMVELAIHNVQAEDSNYHVAHRALQDFIEKIDTEYPLIGQLDCCTIMLRTMGEKLVKPKARDAARGNGFLHAIYAAKVTTIFLCGVVVTALACKPKWRSLVMNPPRVSSQCLWTPSLLSLQQRVKKETEASFRWLGKLGMVDLLVRDVHKAMDKKKGAFDFNTKEANDLRLSATSLASALESLGSGLPSLEEGVNKLFQLLVATRNALLLVNAYNNK